MIEEAYLKGKDGKLRRHKVCIETGHSVIDIRGLSGTIEYSKDPKQVDIAKRKLAILMRDGFQCTQPKCPNNTELTIDRDPDARYFSQNDPRHYYPRFCKTLCAQCHKKIEIKRGKWMPERREQHGTPTTMRMVQETRKMPDSPK